MKQTSMILMSDFYKQAHAEQYPEGIVKLVSYATARMSRIPGQEYLTVFGVQAFCKDFLIERFNETFFDLSEDEAIGDYVEIIKDTFPIHCVGIDKFRDLHRLGYLPIEISCIDEGRQVPIRSAYKLSDGECQVPFIRITNTHPDFPWVVEFLESVMSSEVWYPCCIANQAYRYRMIVNKWFEYTGCDMAGAKSAISEFGFRGGEGSSAATMASAAFLTSFNKTATIPAIKYLRDYYNADITGGKTGGGMLSTEHSVMCSNYAVDEQHSDIKCILRDGIDADTIASLNRGDHVMIPRYGEMYGKGMATGAYDIYEYLGGEPTPGASLLSVMTSNGEKRFGYFKEAGSLEEKFLHRLMTEVYPAGAVSVVADSYDYWNAVSNIICKKLKDDVLSRDGCIYVRGDSGDPVDIICGIKAITYASLNQRKNTRTINDQLIYAEDEGCWYKFRKTECEDAWDRYEEEPPEVKGTVQILWEAFGGTTTSKGYKVLDSHIRAIYGDSITPTRAEEIYHRLADKGFAANNVALGAGSFSTQCLEYKRELLPFTRDSYGIAIKATYAEDGDGIAYQIFKDPITDSGKFKKSQKGMVLVKEDEDGSIHAYDHYTSYNFPEDEDIMRVIYRDGKMVYETSLDEVRSRLHHGNF